MPTPRPIMAIISGAKVGTVRMWLSRSSDGEADGDAEQGGDDRQTHGHHRPKAMSMMIMAATMPKPSLDPGAASPPRR